MGRRWKTGMRHWDVEEMEDEEMGRRRRRGCGTGMRRRWGWEPTKMERRMRMGVLPPFVTERISLWRFFSFSPAIFFFFYFFIRGVGDRNMMDGRLQYSV
jgi:hypothetical protein